MVTDAEPTVTVREVMRTPAPTVATTDSVATVARTLVEHGIPGVPVLDDGRLVGIITESDLVAREADVSMPTMVPFLDALFVADAGTPFEEDLRRVLAQTAGELMSSPVYSIRARATLSEVATFLIERRINQAPVVDDDGALVGLVSRSDLVRVIARLESADQE